MKIIIKFLFYVIGPCIALIATTHGTDFLQKELHLDLKWNNVIVGTYFVIACVYLIFEYILDKKRDLEKRLKGTEEDRDSYKYELQHHGNSFWRELKYLSQYKENEVLYSTMEKFVKFNDGVIATELYEFQTITSSFIKNKTTVKLNHKTGYVTEGESQNSILQSYFIVPTNILHFFLKAREMARLNYRGSSRWLVVFARRYMRMLDNKDLKDLTKSDAFIFSLLILTLQELGMYREIGITKHDHELYKIQKTGILRGVIDDGRSYEFTYKKESKFPNEKKDRHYLSRKLSINGKQCIVVITIKVNENNNKNDFDKMGQEFLELLVDSDLTVEY
ncbi:hypothetical protein [Bacillus cereus]